MFNFLFNRVALHKVHMINFRLSLLDLVHNFVHVNAVAVGQLFEVAISALKNNNCNINLRINNNISEWMRRYNN